MAKYLCNILYKLTHRKQIEWRETNYTSNPSDEATSQTLNVRQGTGSFSLSAPCTKCINTYQYIISRVRLQYLITDSNRLINSPPPIIHGWCFLSYHTSRIAPPSSPLCTPFSKKSFPFLQILRNKETNPLFVHTLDEIKIYSKYSLTAP